MRVEVYFNLHKYIWSVRSCRTVRVMLHTDEVHIDNPTFVVRKAGRERVLREGKKNVHAFVRGDATYFTDYGVDLLDDADKKCPTLDNVGYNPYKYDSFVKWVDETPVRKAKRAYLSLEPRYNCPHDTVYRPYIYAEGAEPC